MRGARLGLAIGIFSIVVTMAVIGYQMFFGPDRLDLSPEGWPKTLESGEWLALLIIPGVLLITGLAMLPFRSLLFPVQVRNGVSAPARVIKVWDTGVSVNDNPEVGLLLEVSPSTIAAYQAKTAQVISRLQAALVQPGIAAEVKYDPKNPTRVEIVSLELPSPGGGLPRGDAAARLQELKDLRDRDLVSEDEHQAKRQEILRGV